MPLVIENNYHQVSLSELVRLREQGFSVLKSPHVGNQHPSNLVCAALGIPMEMVSFTQGVRDCNFHPHLRIVSGVGTELYPRQVWTPFARVPYECLDVRAQQCERRRVVSATEYHQTSLTRVFPHTEVVTDMERMQQYPALAAMVLYATNQPVRGMWYRRTSADGHVTKLTQSRLSAADLETNVFQFSNGQSGWVIPNRVHIIFDFVYQALSSGRDVVYHLSGPQMVDYIGDAKLQRDLQLMYDAVRQCIPDLPLTLRVRIVPVAGARFAGLQSDVSAIKSASDVLRSMDLTNLNVGWYHELAASVPGVVLPIETGRTLSQYDLRSATDLHIDPWMVATPLSTVNWVQQQLQQAHALPNAAE